MHSQKGAIKSAVCVVWCHHKKHFDRQKSTQEQKEEEKREEGEKFERLPKRNDKPLGNMGEGGDGANEAAAPPPQCQFATFLYL